ncbi:glutathione S-transferase family protein [Aurantiacibacter poecillastricola]|uniref:glutathione S-transferase family protein n=1 Tax=Aurantiacibacter poecillastricola TaxID=3064385 RepID=UPI00273DC869|nr:glutathione S-transferase family protein [Aurantiacibacter sp. 219JJ12-13]MDP5263642.1 glutathione S-transferase family protein [Aurantiacibacter sp. 219JJ12-13]
MNANKPPVLVGETFSPWTKKARWALEHCKVAYDYDEYVPTLSEPRLRWRLRQWGGDVSVPVLFADDRAICGSWEIADFANDASDDQRLGDFSAIEPWNDLSEAALAEGRARVLMCISGNDEALAESLPEFIPLRLRRPLRFLARDGARRLERKYRHLVEPGALRASLLKARQTLAKTESGYLLDQFSYADIAMAVVLEIIAPIARHEPQLGRATETCWNDPALSEEFADLIAWRDRLAGDERISYSQFKRK